MKMDMSKRDMGRRPYLASECKNLADCEFWRRGLLKEITRKVADIQNAGLGEHQLRDMNDNINKKIREKRHWERQILKLGGPNYLGQNYSYDADGREVGGGGYVYFGATKNLPGVRELFAPPEKKKKKRTRHQIFQNITPDYYGYRDDDDGILERVEAVAEKQAVQVAVAEYNIKKRQRLAFLAKAGSSKVAIAGEVEEASEESDEADRTDLMRAHVIVPNQEEIAKLIMQKRKEALMAKFAMPVEPTKADTAKVLGAKYASKDLLESQAKAKQFLNIKA